MSGQFCSKIIRNDSQINIWSDLSRWSYFDIPSYSVLIPAIMQCFRCTAYHQIMNVRSTVKCYIPSNAIFKISSRPFPYSLLTATPNPQYKMNATAIHMGPPTLFFRLQMLFSFPFQIVINKGPPHLLYLYQSYNVYILWIYISISLLHCVVPYF